MSDERPLGPNGDDIRRFFRLLGHEPHGLTELRVIPPRGKPWLGFFDAEDAFVEACATWSGKANVYAGRNPRPRAFAERSPQAVNQLARGVPGAKSADIEVVTALSLDIDPVRAKDTPSSDPEHALALATAKRIAADYSNAVVIDSGNGGHVLFPVHPVSVDGDARVITARVRAWEAEIREEVESDPALAVDSIHDPSRILRVPGTLNIKGVATEERPHRLARIVGEIPSEPCDMSEVFERPVTDLRPPIVPGGIPARFYDLLEQHQKLRATWLGRRKDLQDSSNSGYDMALASRLFALGFSYEEATAILLNAPPDHFTRDPRRVMTAVDKAYYQDDAALGPVIRKARSALIVKLDCIRESGKPQWEKQRIIADAIVHHLKETGFFVRTQEGASRGYYFDDTKKRLLSIEDPRLIAHIHDRFGVSEGEKTLFGHAMAAIRTECIERGREAEVHRVARYDREARLLYVSRFDGQVYRLDGEGVVLVPNGTAGVLFADAPSWDPWEYQEGVTGDPLFSQILDRIHFASGEGVRLSPNEQRTLAGIWVRLLFLPELLPTKPIVLFLGEAGSGKTTALRLILKTLFGPAADVESVHRNKEDAFVASISGGHLVAFDNVDGRIDWLNDRLATCATGGQITLRKLYTTNETETFRPRCFLALTARTPRFRREDVADRLLLFRVERLQEFRPERELIDGIAAHRNEVLSAILNDLNEIVRALRSSEPDDHVRFRMADFGTMAVFLARTADGEEGADAVRSILAKMEEEQGDYAVEDEPLYHALGLWLEREGNTGRALTTRELFEELSRTAKDHGLYWPYRNAVSFGVRLASVWTPLTRRIPGRRETQHGRTRVYRFGDEPTATQMELGE